MTTLSVEDTSQDSGDDDTPPVTMTTKPPGDQPITDDNSLLAVRSKLFYKKNESYVELGNSFTDVIVFQIQLQGLGY